MKREFILSISFISVLLNAMREGDSDSVSCRSIHEGFISHLCERARFGDLEISPIVDVDHQELPDQAERECERWCQRFSQDTHLKKWLASCSTGKKIGDIVQTPLSIVSLYHLRQHYIAQDKGVPSDIEKMYKDTMRFIWLLVCTRRAEEVSEQHVVGKDRDYDTLTAFHFQEDPLADGKKCKRFTVRKKNKILYSRRLSFRRSASGYHEIGEKSGCFARRKKNKEKRARKKGSGICFKHLLKNAETV